MVMANVALKAVKAGGVSARPKTQDERKDDLQEGSKSELLFINI